MIEARLAVLADWSAAAIHDAINEVATQQGAGLGKIAQPIRVAVSGAGVSPPIDNTLEILGRDTTVARIRKAVTYCTQFTE